MRAVHAADERTHVRGGAGPGDENEIALQALAFEASRG